MRKLVILPLLFVALYSSGQHTLAGRIEFERKINMHAQMEDMQGNAWAAKMIERLPKFTVSYFDMIFDTARTMYKPGRKVEDNSMFKMFGSGPATENVVLTDFSANTVKASKKVFEQTYFVVDSIRQIDWKEKDEIRTIANFKCRKAVGIICDSVYVVAFYTEDIVTAGGPEMFGGLPGMIMELAIPRLHTTWIATKVEMIPPKPSDYEISDKGKKVNEQQLYEEVYEGFKRWGEKMAARNVWWTVL